MPPRNLTLFLFPVFDGDDDLAGRFSFLPTLLLGTRFDAATGQFDTQTGDELRVLVAAFQAGDLRRAVAVHRLNVVAWPAPDGDRLVFTTCFREDPDRPDAAILAAGDARFEQVIPPELPPLDCVHGAPEPFPPAGATLTEFQMAFPTRLDLIRPGRFSVAVSLTLRLGEGEEAVLRTFRTDPEMNVAGSYP